MYLTDHIFFVGIKDYRLFVRTSTTHISTYILDLIYRKRTRKILRKSETLHRLAWTLICTTTHQTMRLSAVVFFHCFEKKKNRKKSTKNLQRNQLAETKRHCSETLISSENETVLKTITSQWQVDVSKGAFMDCDRA